VPAGPLCREHETRSTHATRQRERSRERALLREDAGEQESGRKEQFPHVGDVGLQARRTGLAGHQQRQSREHRAEAAEEQHQRHDSVQALPWVLAQDHEAEQEHESAQHEIHGRQQVGTVGHRRGHASGMVSTRYAGIGAGDADAWGAGTTEGPGKVSVGVRSGRVKH
jgi:hypothetical protein